ncbi:NAD(+) synthase [Draconibacterium sp.]|jgi:NAD+ synthase
MDLKPTFTKDILKINDIESNVNAICNNLKNDIQKVLRRKGGIIGISGGIDSSVTLALAVRAIGADKIIGLMLPEKDSSPDSLELAKVLADKFGIQYEVENISGALDGLNCYKRRDEAVKRVFPEYNPLGYKFKIGITPNPLNPNLPAIFNATIIDSLGEQTSKILPITEYLQIVAASNFKQRTRMSMLYYYAEKMHYSVIGTPNKHEVEQGFFVKHGDGGADVMPIAHLYKTQVYQIAQYLGVPQEIIDRTPTTDTYSAEQTQEEFFFQLPFHQMDLLWYAFENSYSAAEVGEVMGMTEKEVQGVFNGFARKIKTTEYLRMSPIKY